MRAPMCGPQLLGIHCVCLLSAHRTQQRAFAHCDRLVLLPCMAPCHATGGVPPERGTTLTFHTLVDCIFLGKSSHSQVAVKIGPGDWSPNHNGIKINGKDLKLCCSGYQFAVWEGQS